MQESIVLIQLSDIHFRATQTDLLSRVSLLKGAVTAKYPKAAACFLLLSGDVANTAAPAEYTLAFQFVEQLREELSSCDLGPVYVVSIPGNHDLNLTGESDVRQLVLENPEAFVRKKIDFSGKAYLEVISVQDNFFDFEATFSQNSIPNEKRVFYKREFVVGESKILFHCFNTAWLSRRHELQGKLFVPPELLDSVTPSDVRLSVALLHHPYNWLDATNQREVKGFIESQTDVALTGHEHDQGIARVSRFSGQSVDYFAAPAFSDPNAEANGFQILAVNLSSSSQSMHVFAWSGVRFSETKSETWNLHRNALRAIDPLTLRPKYLSALNAIGTGFSHPRCTPPQCELQLSDLYVYPDLVHKRLDDAIAGGGAAAKSFSGSTLSEFLEENKFALVFGADDSGKTCLAKVLFQELVRLKQRPLLLKGSDLKGVRDDAQLLRKLNAGIIEAYNTTSSEPFLQAEQSTKVLIIDDFDQANLNRDAQDSLLKALKSRFGKVVVFASDIFELQNLASPHEQNPFAQFERCTLKEFGRFHRQKLIERWHRLGQEDQAELDATGKKVSATDKTLSTLLGKNVLPHHPVIILTLLQMIESKEPTNTANGAYGYMYEVLIKTALAKVDRSKVDEKVTYISAIGYHLFKGRSASVTDADLRLLHDNYCQHYDMVRDYSRTVDDLLRAEILTQAPSGYRFKYQYAFYYSAAKYLQDNAARLKEEIQTAVDHIYGDANANVLIFYVYLTKDEELIRHIVRSAKRIYAGLKPCNLDQDVEFLNRLMKQKPPPLELECVDAASHRDEHNRQIDAAHEANIQERELADQITYDDKLQDIVKLSIAFKTLQLLGQILRNFTGSLPGSLKLEITQECYALGMRTLNAILRIPSSDLEAMRQYLGSLIAERTGITDKQKLANRTDSAIVWLGKAAGFGAVKRISYAVGHGDLATTYGRVLEADPSIATRVIDAAIKLDHFEAPVEQDLKRLAHELHSNFFTYSIMRDLVADYLYLYEVKFQTMQMLGATWDIKVSAPQYLLNRAKR